MLGALWWVAAVALQLESPQLVVVLDKTLPRPDTVTYKPRATFSSAQLEPNSVVFTSVGLSGEQRHVKGESTNVTYNKLNDTTAQWTWVVPPVGTVHGTIRLLSSPDDNTTGSVEWELHTVDSPQPVRQVIFSFGFTGLSESGDEYEYSRHRKTWCPPGTGCQEWSTTWVRGHLTMTTDGHGPSTSDTSKWNPPTDPWAYTALLGRSNWMSGWRHDGLAGVAAWSNALTLPFQAIVQGDRFQIGIGRVDVSLRCGNVLPYRLRLGYFNDITGDGKIDGDDGAVWNRRQYPNAHWSVRSSVVWKLGNDYTSYQVHATDKRIPFKNTSKYVEKMSLLLDNTPQILWMVGWQGTGHDTLYPSLNIVNSKLGTAADIYELSKEVQLQYNTVLSYHINTDEAYWNFTEPGKNGQHNPECNVNILAKEPNGNPWVWQIPKFTDPLQGPAYHISKAKDYVTGQRFKRYQEMLDVVPVKTSLMMDAWRDIDVSWETDERGFIAENEEMRCGGSHDGSFWRPKGVSLAVEGQNGMASNPMGLLDVYWHGNRVLNQWGKLITATDMGTDNDMTPTSSPFTDWNQWADSIYLKSREYHLHMTSEWLGGDRYANGGTNTKWPYGGDIIPTSNQGGRFYPAVGPPTGANPPWEAPVTIDPFKVFVYQSTKGLAPSCGCFDSAVNSDTAMVGERVCDYPIGPSTMPVDDAVAKCRAACNGNRTWCEGWDVIKVTATSGRKQPACRLYRRVDSCHHDLNQVCGLRAATHEADDVDAPPAGSVAHCWTLPLSWVGAKVTASTITPQGKQSNTPPLTIVGRRLTLYVNPGHPVVLNAVHE